MSRKNRRLKIKERLQRGKTISSSKVKLAVQQLISVVNNNSAALQAFQTSVNNINKLIRRHIIILHIVQRKLEITDEQIQEEAQRLIDESKERTQEGGVQSEEARTDEDRGGHGEPELLHPEDGGELEDDPASSSGGAPEDVATIAAINPTPGTSEG